MTSKERVYTTLQHREPDRVPVGEVYVDYPIIERVLGRPTFYRAHARETFALWEGRRDEVVDRQKRDLVEFVRRTGLDVVPVWPVLPRNQTVEKPRRIGENTWEDRAGNVLRYVPQTEDLVVVQQGPVGRGSPDPAPLEQPPPDGSEWELWDYVVQELGPTHFLIASGGTALGIGGYTDVPGRFRTFEEWMLRLRDDPEGIAEEELRHLQGYRETVRTLAARGLDAVRISPDYGYGRATYCSPELFRRAFLPGLRGLCEEIHAGGLVVLFHCDANMAELTDQMVEAGVDLYQSIEPHEPIDRYKREIGDRLTLWGGVSCHDLCTATPDEIRRQARFALRYCAPGGGFILGSSHNVLTATRYENFMAMLEVAFTEGRYPLA
jgi:uroporphyrinogen decarboxylase